MFTKQVIQHTIWSRQKDHGFPIASRSVPVNFSLGPRSSLVRYSLVYRRPIENRTRNKRKTNERATNVGRETIEKSTSSHRHGWLMAGSWQTKFPPATTNQKNAFCLKPTEVESCTSCPTLSIFSANKTISSIPTDPMLQPCRNSLHGFLIPCYPPNDLQGWSWVHPKTPYHKPNSPSFRLNHRTNHKNHVKPYKNPQYYHFVQCGYCNFTNEA